MALYTQLTGKWRTSIQIAVQIPAAICFATAHVILDGLVNGLVSGPFYGSFISFVEIFFPSKLFVNLVFYYVILLFCVVVDYRQRLAGLTAELERGGGSTKHITLHDGHRRIRMPLSEILWFEAINNYVGVHTVGGTEIARETLTRLQALLPEEEFARVHRSAIVKLTQTMEWQPLGRGDGRLTLSDGSIVRVSRRYRAAIEGWLREL